MKAGVGVAIDRSEHDLLQDLNPEQREAVLTTEGPLLVVAGAGSGKTSVLTRRIAYLLVHEGVPPWSVLAITFTNKAAREMRERVERFVGPASTDIWVSTFHAMCVRILRRDIEKLGYASHFTILDSADQQVVMKRTLDELDYDTRKFDPRAMLAGVSRHKNMLVTPVQARQRADSLVAEVVAAAYERYQEKLRGNNALDFDDLIMKTVELLQTDEEIREFYRRKFQHVLVDEYQDTNHSQYRLVRLIADGYQNLCVVGDSDQSIYRWRGADIANILSFERDYPAARVIKLEQNYRSTKAILRAANGVIQNNRGRPDKTLWTDNSDGSLVLFARLYDERDEARFIVEEAMRRRDEERVRLSDIAVLYRTNAQSRVIEEACMKAGVPYRVFGGIRFYERKEIKDVLAYLRLVANPDDDMALERVINVPKRGIGEGTLARVREYADAHGLSLFAAMREHEMLGLSVRFTEQFDRFTTLVRQWAAMQEYLTVTELVGEVLQQSGYREMLKQENTIEAQARLENVDELLSVTREFDQRETGGGLLEFLSDVTLVADADQQGGAGDGLVLMTLHSAKGLEFPIVFLPALEEGVFPHSRTFDDPDELEEERRLCYVGITRARRELYLSCAASRTLYGYSRSNAPSRFLKEIPPDVLREWERPRSGAAGGSGTGRGAAAGRMHGGRGQDEGLGQLQVPANFGADPTIDWQIGDEVEHRKWGTGIVRQKDGAGDDCEVTVEFAAPIGLRRLMVRFAPIRKAQE